MVSIITATYNRSNVLSYAIRSVLAQTVRDWELIVVGDACTDDTAAVVASFGDPRIVFCSRDRNAGEQSAANNDGFRLSTGAYVAYLNHDDLWLPHHLETLLADIERTGADLVFSLMCLVNRDGHNELGSVTPTGRYHPDYLVPASSWLARRELIEAVGPWHLYRDCYEAPSQEWLMRARRAGKDLRSCRRMTVVAIQSGSRQGSYSTREVDEHRLYAEQLMREPGFVETQLTEMAVGYRLRHPVGEPHLTAGHCVRRVLKSPLKWAAERLGVHPTSVRTWLFGTPQKGEWLVRARRVRGLPPLGTSKETRV